MARKFKMEIVIYPKQTVEVTLALCDPAGKCESL